MTSNDLGDDLFRPRINLGVFLNVDHEFDKHFVKFWGPSFIFLPPEGYSLSRPVTFDLAWPFQLTWNGRKWYCWTPQAVRSLLVLVRCFYLHWFRCCRRKTKFQVFDLTCDVINDLKVKTADIPTIVFHELSFAFWMSKIGPLVSEIQVGAKLAPPVNGG